MKKKLYLRLEVYSCFMFSKVVRLGGAVWSSSRPFSLFLLPLKSQPQEFICVFTCVFVRVFPEELVIIYIVYS